ncbi:hypothetical protein CAEBREN_16966 [Caenorhabditis brenneri]|uniref:Uncharacterized protein n=1 Tax=Caenorhabditis brenneri TaxID=135651 RepID=G0MLM5_CAEBE|nr:hypothetical protein CAEBREN_16966 [Caenorhabditis brenneri]
MNYIKCAIVSAVIVIFLIGFACLDFLRSTSVDNYDPTISDKRLIRIYENMIDALETPSLGPSRYKKRPETQHVDCGRVLRNDEDYIRTLKGEHRIPLIKNRQLNMSCKAIKSRINYHKSFKKLKSGGVAFARIVSSDYEFIERQVEMSWHPQNFFCFAVDKDAPRSFQENLKKLGECMENIVVIPETMVDQKILNKPMKVVSGSVQSSWSREAVRWLIEDADLTIAISQFDQTSYASDEQLFPSLQVNKEYGMPGHYTHECLDQEAGNEQITRFVNWAHGDINNCVTKTVRNGVCLVGIEEFYAISKMPAIVISEMLPSFDYTVLECTAELLFNRTFLNQLDNVLDEEYYKTLPAVLYHKNRDDPEFQVNCTSSHKIWKYDDYFKKKQEE